MGTVPSSSCPSCLLMIKHFWTCSPLSPTISRGTRTTSPTTLTATSRKYQTPFVKPCHPHNGFLSLPVRDLRRRHHAASAKRSLHPALSLHSRPVSASLSSAPTALARRPCCARWLASCSPMPVR